MAYEQAGRSPLLLTSSATQSASARPLHHQEEAICCPTLQVPLLVFDDDTYRHVGPLDEGYMYQGGIAEWIQRARIAGYHEDRPELHHLLLLDHADGGQQQRCVVGCTSPLHDRQGPGQALGEWVKAIDVISPAAANGGSTLDRLYQRDMDTFYLQQAWLGAGPCQQAAGGRCVKEGGGNSRLTPEDEGFYKTWSGRSISEELIPNQQGKGWREKLRVAAVLCVYDDTTFLRELVIDLTAQLQHVLVLVSAIPWHGDVRGDNGHTMKILADLMDDPALHRDRLSVVKGRWSSEAEQRQVRQT